jgi:serine/threonine protein kinase/Tol biopolymer transport system component
MSSHLSPGTKLSRYEIRSLLGAGGMGEVYLAEDTKLDRKVALKILPAKVAANPESMRRFVQEAKAASALNHPNIVTIYEIEEITSTRFIATEFIDGETLREHMRHTPLKINKVIEVSIQIADALTAAHEAGIVHRDVKPENIMLRRRDGYVKVLDFGLAKLTERHDETIDLDAATKARIVTEPGVVLGTVQYMSPEQARGLTVDARTDIFSLGVVLYEMLAGCAPFKGETRTDILAAILDKEPPPLARYSSEVPEMLEWIVTKAIRKSRAERYQTARELLTDLRSLKQRLDFAAEQERSVPPATRGEAADAATGGKASTETVAGFVTATEEHTHPTTSAEYLVSEAKRHKGGVILVLTALVIAVAGVGFGLKYFGGQPTKSAEPFSKIKLTRITTTGKAGLAGISPDGKYVAHVMGDAGQQSIWLRHIDTGSDKEIAPSIGTGYCCPFFTHDGSYIYYSKSATNGPNVLYQAPVLGGTTRTIIEDIDSRASLSPNGKQLAFIRGYPTEGKAALVVANADGPGEQKLATFDIVDFFPVGNTMFPAWSPDGATIVLGAPAVDATGSYRQMLALRTKDGAATPITSQRWSSLGQFEWLRDGTGLIFTASDQAPGSPQQVWYTSYPGGETRRITNDLNDYRGITLTADSRALVTLQTDPTASIWIAPSAEAHGAAQITANKYDGLEGIAFVPDGRVVYTSRVGGNLNLWITKPDGTGQKQLTTDPHSHLAPAVSPDGRYVVFVSDSAGSQNVWRMDIDGGNPKQLTKGKADQYPTCSPDSQWVVYTSNDGGKQRLWKVPIDGGDAKQLTNFTSARGVISRDGKQLACAYLDEQGKSPRWVGAIIPFAGGQPIKKFDVPRQRQRTVLSWSLGGRELTYIATRAGVSNIWSQPVDGGPPKQLTDFKSNLIFFFDWSRDGKQLALARGSVTSDVVLINEIK